MTLAGIGCSCIGKQVKMNPGIWFLISLDRTALLKIYRKRMWVEEMYGDMKGHGFDLEATHLQRCRSNFPTGPGGLYCLCVVDHPGELGCETWLSPFG